MFDKDLFIDLCKKYDIELSDKYDTPMIKKNGKLIPIKNKDIEYIFNIKKYKG